MNIRNHLIEIQCGYKDITDVAQALVHSIIFFRTHGKFNYKHEGSYSIGTLGYERAVCDHVDFSYIRCCSGSLINKINAKIQEFVEKINEFTHSGTLTLEFYTKRPSRWPFNDAKIVWELWKIKIVIIPGNSTTHGTTATGERNADSKSSIRIEDLLSNKLFDIIRIVNSDKCSLPQMPIQPNLDTVFDVGHSDLQPYLHCLSYKISETAPTIAKHGDGSAVSDTTQSSLKKFLLGTLEL